MTAIALGMLGIFLIALFFLLVGWGINKLTNEIPDDDWGALIGYGFACTGGIVVAGIFFFITGKFIQDFFHWS